MNNPVLRINTQTLAHGRNYTLPFYIGNLKETPIVYSVQTENDKQTWTQIEPHSIDNVNGEFRFHQRFETEQHGNIFFTFYLFVRGGNRLFCWKASAALDIPNDNGNVSIVVDKRIVNTASEGGAIYNPTEEHNVNINVNTNGQVLTPLSVEFVRKEDYEKFLPIGRCSEKLADRWKMTFPDGKETVLLTNNSITVGRSRKHSIHFNSHALPEKTKGKYTQQQLKLYDAITSAKYPLQIAIDKDYIYFQHRSDRRITINEDYVLSREESEPYQKSLQYPYSLFFEYFLPLHIRPVKPAERFTHNDWNPMNSLVPPEVLRELLHGGQHPLPCESLRPVHFTTSAGHHVTQLSTFIETKDNEGYADSCEFFKQNPDNLWHFRDYYFTGDGFIWTLPDGTEARIMNAGGHLYILIPNESVVCNFPSRDTYNVLNPNQPVLLQHGMEVLHYKKVDEEGEDERGERIFTFEQL